MRRVFKPVTSDNKTGHWFKNYVAACGWLDRHDPGGATAGFVVKPSYVKESEATEYCLLLHSTHPSLN